MTCVECGNDDVCEGYTMCSDCLEYVTPVTVDKGEHGWVVACETHGLHVTCFGGWDDAYEMALGHAAFKHKSAENCRRRGHDWERKYPGHRSDLYACRRCGEPGWQIWEDMAPVAIDA